MNLAELLAASARRLGPKAAFLHGADGRSALSYADLDRAVDGLAAGLAARGVAPGERVALAMGNGPRFPIAYLGILRAGAVAVPINGLLTSPETARILDDSGAAMVLGDGEPGATAAGAAGDRPVVLEDGWDDLVATKGAPPRVAAADDDLAVLAYTSGTTGRPKGAMLTHGNLTANLRQQLAVPGATVEEDDVLFLALPLFHIFGLNVGLGLTIVTGATGLIVERFEPIPSLALIQDRRVTVLFGAPTMFSAWVSVPGADQYDLSRVRLAVSGAAPLPPDVLRDFKDMFGVQIFEGYGLTETAPTLTSARMSETVRPRSIGKALPEVELRLVDESGTDVELGDPGEIVVRGPNVFKGYWGLPDETRAAFHGEWFRTGDVAVRDEEGYLYLVDRKRDLIIVSGFNVFPSEVEAALLGVPGVEEAAVIGEPHPYTGEAVRAFVVVSDGADVAEADIRAELSGRLARFKHPRVIEMVGELPHGLTGKVLRRALRT